MRLPALLLAVFFAACGAAGARAAEGSTPPYETDLLRLAEILGGLHYLRPLCGMSAEAQTWRNEMQGLMETEQPSDIRKARLVAAFNQGYNSYAQVYRTCTPAAAVAHHDFMGQACALRLELA